MTRQLPASGDGTGAVMSTESHEDEVERRVVMSNEDARDVLEEMGFEMLTEADARLVLEKRVELSS